MKRAITEAWRWLCDHRNHVAYVVLTIGFAVSLVFTAASDRRSTNRARIANAADVHRNCLTGQRSWDTLSAVIKEAYRPAAASTVDPATLPPRTQALLADLQPLLKASGNASTNEARVRARLGERPHC